MYLKKVVTLGCQRDGRTGVVAVVLFSFHGRLITLTVPDTLLGPHLCNRNTDHQCSVLTGKINLAFGGGVGSGS